MTEYELGPGQGTGRNPVGGADGAWRRRAPLLVGAGALGLLLLETIAASGSVRAGAAPRADSCTASGCHGEVVDHRLVHAPVAADHCRACHQAVPRGTPFEPGARHQFLRASDDPQACTGCHAAYDEEPHVHEPVRQGLCVLCHDPHGAPNEYLLRVDSDRQLCLQCHRETFADERGLHGPVELGACGACHDPHASSRPFRLRGTEAERCGLCHSADLREVLAGEVVHPPVAADCANCHEPHAGVNPKRLIGVAPGLCLDCHQDIAAQLETRELVHQPVAEGRCLDCHDQHSADHARLLRREFTQRPYEPFDLEHYQLCYGCHDPAHVTQPETRVTAFRNGERNLHYVHVNQAEKGRTCNVCHEVHASDYPALTRERPPFGIWEAPLGLERTPTGGACGPGCHEARAYDRETPVPYR